MTPKRKKSAITPSHVENGARARTAWRMDSASAISVYQTQGFDQPRIAHWEERRFADNPQINERQCGAERDHSNKIPKAEMYAGAVQGRQHDEIHVEHLHEQNPAGDQT